MIYERKFDGLTYKLWKTVSKKDWKFKYKDRMHRMFRKYRTIPYTRTVTIYVRGKK